MKYRMRSNLISLKKTLIDPQLLCLIFVGEMIDVFIGFKTKF